MVKPQGMLGASQGGLFHFRNTQGCPGLAVTPQALEVGVCVSRGRPSRAETEPQPQGGLGGTQGLRGSLRQAEVRSNETRGNAGHLPKRPLLFQ